MAILIPDELDAKYANFKIQVSRLQDRCQNSIDEMAAGSVVASALISLHKYLKQSKTRLITFSGIPGIVQHVKDFEDNQNYDVSDEITALNVEITATLAKIDVDFPESGNYKLYLSIVDEEIVDRTFSSAQTAGVRTELQGIVDAIG